MEKLTLGAVYARLAETYGSELTIEQLAAKTGIPTRTLGRYKSGADAKYFDRVVELLTLAGYLIPETPPNRTAADLQRARLVAARLADEMEELAGLLDPDRAADG